jgi:hypothetical protein
MNMIRHITQRFFQILLYPYAMLVVEFSNLGVKCRPIGDDLYGALSIPTHHQDCLKVSRTYPISHDIRPLLDRDTIRNRPSGILESAMFAAPATMLQEAVKTMLGTVYGLMASRAIPYPPIQALMAYRTQYRMTTYGTDDLRAPFVMDLPMGSLFLHSLREQCPLGLLLMGSFHWSLSLVGRICGGTTPSRRSVTSQFPAYHRGMYPDGLCNRFLTHACVS